MPKNRADQNRKHPRAFTLVEILVALAITGLMMAALVYVFANQQITYARQTELAKAQSSARGSLHSLARDIRMAGYTSVPLGMENLALKDTAYAVLSIRNGDTPIPEPHRSNNLAASLPTGGGDVIEIWGNFGRRNTELTADVNAGENEIEVADPELFKASGINTPGWIVVGDNEGRVEMHGVVNGDTNPIQLAGGATFQNDYQASGGESYVAPLCRRVYYVDPQGDTNSLGEDVSVLFMRNCVADDCTTSGNFREVAVAEDVDELEFLYHVFDQNTGTLIKDRHMECDPCSIRGVKVRIRTVSTAERERPFRQNFATAVRIRNVGLQASSCPITGCGSSY
ncbi:MAG: prepilin-type N-terminal cleavage/methylation domain-containing protein [bacterium]